MTIEDTVSDEPQGSDPVRIAVPGLPSEPTNLGTRRSLTQNALTSGVRVIVNSLVLIFLPVCLTHWMSVTDYAAWVLILQLGAYILFLDIGIQTGVAKYVAESVERHDLVGAGKSASAGMALMLVAASLGVLLTLGITWQIPRLLGQMPPTLYADARWGVLLIGLSQSVALVASVYAAVFLGLQRYSIPVFFSILNRCLFAGSVISVAYCHGSLRAMGTAGAAATVLTGLLQYVAWRRQASYVMVKVRLIDLAMLGEMLRYCSILAVWSFATLCISGLDLLLVGHYDFSQTAYYSIAAQPNNLMITLLTAMLSPLIPAAAALGTRTTPIAIGQLLLKAGRYASLFLLLCGMPLIIGGQAVLQLWVGPEYARHALLYLRILVIANFIRYSFAPYATMVVALGRQKVATASCIAEALVNLVCSVVLALKFGAIGVAYGTLAGAIVGVLVHVLVSMHYTKPQIRIRAMDYLTGAVFRPLMIAGLSALVLLVPWDASSTRQGLCALTLAEIFVATAGILVMLTRSERLALATQVRSRLLRA